MNIKIMKKLLIILILILTCIFIADAQRKIKYTNPFPASADTMMNTNPDTLDMRIGMSGLNLGPWETLTRHLSANDTVYITADDKTGERSKFYLPTLEVWWTWCEVMQLRIRGSGDTLNSNVLTIGDTQGAITIQVQPDTILDSTADTTLYNVYVGGM